MPAVAWTAVTLLGLALFLIAVSVDRRVQSSGERPPDERGPWRRHVSPIFFVLLVVAGLMIGGLAFAVMLSVTPVFSA